MHRVKVLKKFLRLSQPKCYFGNETDAYMMFPNINRYYIKPGVDISTLIDDKDYSI